MPTLPSGKAIQRGLTACLLLATAACSTVSPHGYYQHDGPLNHRHPGSVPDAIPRAESLSSRGNAPYTVLGQHYYPLHSPCGYRARGTASWYGRQFYKGRTSDGEHYNMFAMTAAHKTLPLPSYVRVTNRRNGRSVVVRVNDRGPFLHGRIIDLSYAAAARLGMLTTGTAPVTITDVDVGCHHARSLAPAGTLVQVGAFQSRDDANRLARTLAGDHIGPVLMMHERHGSGFWYLVRVGPFATSTARRAMTRRLSDKGFPATVIATHQ